jgi:Glycosyl transferases group 1
VKGIHGVPVVNGCYLVRNDCLKYVRYRDHSAREEYVIFSDYLRRNLIPQYIDNRYDYGVGINYQDETDISSKLAINNKAFFLNSGKKDRKIGIVCDAGWLSSYIAFEHYHVHRLLQDTYGFHIINDRHLDFTNRALIRDLNTYDVLFLSHQRATIPLDLLKCYKMCRIDDLVNGPANDERSQLYFKNSDMVVSPYAYVFTNYYEHDNVVWVPYSCGIEGCTDPDEIRFNTTPKVKILQLGNVGPSYPFRQYVAGLEDDRIEKIAHPGWNHPDNTEALIRRRYYHKLNEYICCFTDALIFRYIVLKNFEIPGVGALLLTDRAIEKEMNQLGFVDFQTCIFCDQETFLDRVSWILEPKNREAVDRIRRAGMDLVWAKHLTKHRAAQINDLVTQALGRRASRSLFV